MVGKAGGIYYGDRSSRLTIIPILLWTKKRKLSQRASSSFENRESPRHSRAVSEARRLTRAY